MGLLGIVLKVAGAIVLVLVGLGAYLYFTDYEAQATVTETGRDEQGPYAVITPRIAPFYDHRAPLDNQSARFVCDGYVVHFRLQTQVFQVFDATGSRLVYDSQRGLVDVTEAARCGASQSGGILG